jgi:hypothetical protein
MGLSKRGYERWTNGNGLAEIDKADLKRAPVSEAVGYIVMPEIRMNSLKSFAMNCGPLSEMIRGRASGYFRPRSLTDCGRAAAPPGPLSHWPTPRQSRWSPLWPVLVRRGPSRRAAEPRCPPLSDTRPRFRAGCAFRAESAAATSPATPAQEPVVSSLRSRHSPDGG